MNRYCSKWKTCFTDFSHRLLAFTFSECLQGVLEQSTVKWTSCDCLVGIYDGIVAKVI